MIKKISILVIILLFITGIPTVWYLRYYNADKHAKESHFKGQLGIYILDINKTILGNYEKDSILYKKLQIDFRPDSTFIMNMKVPFIFDSIGKWEAGGGGLEDWNRLYYKSNLKISSQFNMCCLPDSTFYINSATPQKGKDFIQEIYFKKIKPR